MKLEADVLFNKSIVGKDIFVQDVVAGDPHNKAHDFDHHFDIVNATYSVSPKDPKILLIELELADEENWSFDDFLLKGKNIVKLHLFLDQVPKSLHPVKMLTLFLKEGEQVSDHSFGPLWLTWRSISDARLYNSFDYMTFEEMYDEYFGVLPFEQYCQGMFEQYPEYSSTPLSQLWKFWKEDFEEMFVAVLSDYLAIERNTNIYVNSEGLYRLEERTQKN